MNFGRNGQNTRREARQKHDDDRIKWSGARRVVFILVASALLWAVLIGAAMIAGSLFH